MWLFEDLDVFKVACIRLALVVPMALVEIFLKGCFQKCSKVNWILGKLWYRYHSPLKSAPEGLPLHSPDAEVPSEPTAEIQFPAALGT